MLPKFPFVILDVEATGLTPRSDRIMELAILRFEEGEKVAEYESLYQIDREIPPHVEVITRIRPGDLNGKPELIAEKEKIEKLIEGAVIIGHNILYDISMMAGEGIELEGKPWIDTAMLASLLFPEHASWSLGYLSAVMDLPHEPKHRSMGDVLATLALFEKEAERISELPKDLAKEIVSLAEKSSEGYATLFSSVEIKGKGRPAWLQYEKGNQESGIRNQGCSVDLSLLKTNTEEPQLSLVSAPVDAHFLCSILANPPACDGTTWIAVKNLDASLRLLDEKALENCTTLHAPTFLLDTDAREEFLKQEALTADELTLALKLLLYEPQQQSDFPIHGEERSVWKGKVACAKDAGSYKKQFEGTKKVVLIDHRHLLELLMNGEGPETGDHVIVDDASMLEDTATKAFRWSCSIDPLRAGAEGNDALTRFLDLYQIWVEKVRNFSAIRYLVEADLKTPDASGLREQLEEILKTEQTDQVRERLEDLQKILEVEKMDGRIVWIEQFRDGGQIVQSVPMDIPNFLWEVLYDKCSTTLLLPPGEVSFFPNLVPKQLDTETLDVSKSCDTAPPLHFADEQLTLDRLLPHFEGKVIALVGSKRTIEQLYVKHMETLEENGTLLIAQGMSGGRGRMQAEFLAASGNAVWLMTPWLYEGVELPENIVDHLWIHTLPFDHPSHAVLSLRAERFKNGFEEYMIPRLLHRLFRLLRTFTRHRKEDGDVLILDDRVRTKGYGKRVKEYLDQLAE